MSTRPLPLLTAQNEFYWTAGREGRLRFQQCRSCQGLVHPPKPVCPYCRSLELGVHEVSGRGTLAGFTQNHQQWNPNIPVPYTVGTVVIDEDPRVHLTTNIVNAAFETLAVGQRMQVVFQPVEDVWLPLFEPTGEPLAADPLGMLPDEEPHFRSVRPMIRADKYEDKAVLRGIGASRLGRKLMVDPLSLTIEACTAAVEDAGLQFEDIDGVSTYPADDGLSGFGEGGVTALEAALRLRPTWHNGGGEVPGSAGMIMNAALAIAAGLCRHVLCFRTVWQASHAEMLRQGKIPVGGHNRVGKSHEMLAPFGAQPVSTVAMAASQHFRRFGTTRETLGWIAINGRNNAMLNPTAVFRDPLSMDDYLAARMISTPLGLLDCDPLCDASLAVVVSAADTAADAPRPAVRIEAIGSQITEPIEWDQGSLVHEPHVLGPSAHVWSRTSLRPSDVDVAELYDGFSFNCLSWIEALGFCGIGEAKDFLDGGSNIARDGGVVAVNTHGGQLSHGRTHGMGLVHEAVTQLRGAAGPRQVADASVAVTTSGGLTPGCVLLLRRP